MIPYLGVEFKRYKPKDINYGVLQDNYFKNNNFVSLLGSSFKYETTKDPYYVLYSNNSLWDSNDESKPSF